MRKSRRLIVVFLLLFLWAGNYVHTAVYYAFEGESSASITPPDVYLEEGTAGTSVVYPNGTSAASQVDSHATTFYPNDYNVTHGLYDSGTTPGSVNQIDSDYFTVNSSGSHTSNLVYHPVSFTLLNKTSTSFDWGINTTSFSSTSTHTNYRYMGGTSPDIPNMKVTKLHIRTTGSGTVAIGLYTGGALNDPTGAVKRTEAYNVAVSAGWNEIDVPDYNWPNNTITWIGWAHNTGVYYSASSGDAGDFQTTRGRWSQTNPGDADETAAMPTNPGAGSFSNYWYSVHAEYEAGSISNLTANDGQFMRFGSYLSASTDLEDQVDNDSSDLDSSSDKGFYTNFTYQQSGPDSQYDELREQYFGNLTLDYVDNNTTDVDSSIGKGTHSNFVNQKSGPDSVYDLLKEEKVISTNDWGINSSSFTSNFAPSDYRYMGGTSPSTQNMKVTKLYIRTTGSGTVAIALYTGGALNDPTGAVKRTEAYNVAVSAGWNEIDVPDYDWPNNTVSWIGFAMNTGIYYSTNSGDAGDFQTARGRWSQTNPGDADETAAMPANPGAGSFSDYWYSVYAEYNITSYKLDLEAQWTNVPEYYQGAEVAIKTGSHNGTEQLQFDFWNSSSQWMTLGTLTSGSWNNFTIGPYPDITNFNVRFKEVTETGDTSRDTWQIDASVIRLLGQGKREDPVDSDTSNVDSSLDVGTHSNFTAHQSGPDSVYDVLTEARFSNNSLIDSESFEGVWPPTGWTDNGGWNNETDQAHDGIISADIDGAENVTLINAESFEGTWPPSRWSETGNWNAESNQAHQGVYSADFDGGFGGPTGDLDTPSFNMTGVHAIYVSFWFMDDDLDAGELMLQYWDGNTWDDIQDLTGYAEDTWHFLEFNVSDSQYFVDDFQVRFSAGPCGWGEHFYLDEVSIKKQPVPETSGDLDTPSINCTGAHAIYVSFWFMDDDLDATDLYLQYWNGSAWNNIQDLTGYTEDTWTYWEQNVTDSQYYVDDFKVRFTANSLGYNEHFYLDEVTVIKEIDASQYEDLDLEIQWTNVAYDLLYEELCIYAGSLDAEDIVVEIWNTTSSGWDTVFSDLTASSWNNASITGWLTSDTVTVRYRGGDTTGDTVKNTWQIDIALIHTWDYGTAEYSLDMEYQWTGVDFTESSEELCIYGGTMGAEDILVDVWNGTWNNVFTDLSAGWNNVSVTQYLNSSTFTIRVRDGTPTSDALFDTWEIDVSLLHVWGDTYTAEVEFDGTSNLYEWTQIEWTVDSAWTNASILVDIQLYNYSDSAYPASGDGFTNYTSGPTNTDETKSQVITDSPMDFRNATSGWKLKVRGEHTSQFELSIDYIALNTTYYDEYTAQTEFVFTDVTDNQSPNLNFTVVNHNSIDGATVTLQVWNYTSSGFPSSGMGYLSYVSTGANNTRWVNVTNNAQSCLSGSYARIRVTSVYSTTDYYQQLTNFVRLLQEEYILVNDYALRVTNNGTDLYTIRLVRISDSNIDRIINCTIYFRTGETQLQVIDGAFTLTTGTWANLPATSSLDILIDTSTIHLQYSSVIDTELEVLRSGTSTYTKYPIQFTIT